MFSMDSTKVPQKLPQRSPEGFCVFQQKYPKDSPKVPQRFLKKVL